jgi:hypothetical protein
MIVYQLAWYGWEYDSWGHNEFAKMSMQLGKQVASCSEILGTMISAIFSGVKFHVMSKKQRG